MILCHSPFKKYHGWNILLTMKSNTLGQHFAKVYDIQNKGYIARPTDQLLKFGLLFQDYMPNIPSMKVYLNLVYNTGLPGGSPSYSDPYVYQNRLRDYRRADVGFSKIVIDNKENSIPKKWLGNFKELAVGVEIFNLFNNLAS